MKSNFVITRKQKMYDNYNFPLGADNENAPWNQQSVPMREFSVSISQSLSKSTKVKTRNYSINDCRDEGIGYEIDTEETDWKEAYDDDHYTPLQLIELFKKYLEMEIERFPDTKDTKRYRELIEECSNWTEDDFEVVED